MNIISIDVGIKHLAICMLCYKEDKSYSIDCWNVLDLCNTKKYICCANQKNGKKCNNNAKFEKNGNLYCKKHSKESGFSVPTSALNPIKIKKSNMKKLRQIIEKHNIPYIYEKSKKITPKFQMINSIIETIDLKYLNHIKNTNKNANHLNMVTLGLSLKEKFKNILDYGSIHTVLIENQIGPIALRMKCLQGMIMQHLIENDVTNIIEVSSGNKLKDFLDGKKTTYSERKKIGIKVTRDLLEKKNELHGWREEFNKNKKRDDLADCFLQGLWYINNKI